MTLFIFVVILCLFLIMNHLYLLHPFRDLDVSVKFDRISSQPNDSFFLNITFENHSSFPILSLDATMRFSGSLRPSDEEWMKEHCTQSMGDTIYHESTWVMPHQRLTIKVPLTADQRGKYVVSSLFLTIGDFLGLKNATNAYQSQASIIIIPERADMNKKLDALGGYLGDQSVQRWIHEDPIIVESYSDYTGREPMKNIAWVQSAKRGNLVVKRYDHTVESKVLLMLDTEDAESFECEQIFSAGRSVMETLDQKNIAYGFTTNANTVIDLQKSLTLGQGSVHTLGLLELLGKAVYGNQMTLMQMIRYVENANQSMQGIILITSKNVTEIQNEILYLEKLSRSKVFTLTVEGVSA